MRGSKYSFQLPTAGVANDVDLEDLLRYVRTESPSKDDVSDWIAESSDETTAEQTLRTLRQLRVIREESNQVLLTQYGQDALDGDVRAVFLDRLIETYSGFDLILHELAEGPKQPSEPLDALDASTPDDWRSTEQISIR